MKRYLGLALVVFLLFTSVGHAASYGKIQVSMHNNRIDVTQVPIIMDGEKVNTDSPSFVHDDRTLVPIRFVEKTYGAKVEWEEKTQSVIVKYKGDEVVLTIDSSTAKINGNKRILDKGSIPRLVTFEGNDTRTMVPLSFLAEALGFEVGWDDENRVPYINSKGKDSEKPTNPQAQANSTIIKNIGVSKGSTDKNKIIVESNKELKYETALIEEDLTFIIDINDAWISQKNIGNASGDLKINDSSIKQVRYSQFSANPDVTRIAIDLKDKKIPNIIPQSDGTGLMISFEGESIGAITKETVDGKEAIVLHGANTKNMNMIKLKNPERFVIDFLDTTLEGKTYANYDYNLGFIKGVRVSQFGADNNYNASDQIVRVVLDVKDGVSDPNVKIQDHNNKVIIFPEKNYWENISYEKLGNERHLIIKELNETYYSLEYDNLTKTLKVKIPTEDVELNDGLMVIKDDLLDGIKVDKGNAETLISLQFKKSVEYTKISKDKDNKVHLIIKKINNIKPKDRLIVIDPGHGGKDPGASSITGKKEKDFVLAASKKLDQKLSALGYNTLMTREKDEFIGLYERPAIANKLNADIFVSMHANAFGNNPAVSGIEVLYCPIESSKNKGKDQQILAKAVLDELIKTTGAKSRGIIKRPKLVVLRETKMPAILVEAGFLTNAAEEKLLFTEEYQNKIVDSIVRGIEYYFEMD